VSTVESEVLEAPEAAGFPGGGTKPPVLGDDDMAAILTPVLLAGFESSVPSFFPGICFFDLTLFFDFEEEVVEVDLSSLVLLAASLVKP